jgi:hypothetical protein
MSIYDNAGVALIPSGTKASKLYSVLPANGDGDFTHSRGSTATRVNKDGLIESVATNVPRLDYPLINGVVQDCPASLLEPSRTNGLQRTEEFDNSYWNKSLISVTANDSVSPDGSQNADKIVSGNSTGNHFFRRTSLTYSATDNTFSIFAKFTDDLFEQFHFVIYDGSNHTAYFDVKNGSVISADSGVTASMINYGNGWYRCIATYQTASTSIGQIKVELGSTSTITGDGTSGMLFWGMMWEVGSYATSYIPWDGSGTTTRSLDVCNKTGVESLLGQTEGTLFLEFVPLDTSALQILFQIRTTGSTNVGQVDIRFQSSQIRAFGSDNSGSTQFSIAGGSITAGTNYKAAIRYKTNDAKFYINGSSVGTDTICSFTSSTKQQISFAENLSSFLPSIKVKQAIVFDEALTDSELATLTS